jgi:murein DD-endopeptidase MepM/ murein hydrolase activator NlpD
VIRIITLLFVMAVSTFVVSAALAGRLTLDGRMVQGGMVVGRTDPGTMVTFQGKPIRVSPEGVFVIGFHRDAKPKAWVVLQFPDGSRRTEALTIKPRKYNIQRIDGLPRKMVTPPKTVLDRIKRENRLIKKARAEDSAVPHFLRGWLWPAKGRISGVYGSQRILNGKPRRPHYGVDIAAPVGTPIMAPSDGVVRLAEGDLYYTGGTIILDHGHGLSSAFLHMQRVTVKPGQLVKQGEKIGTLGSTGRSTGPHLDWRMNLFGARLDPQLLVPPMTPPKKSPKKKSKISGKPAKR